MLKHFSIKKVDIILPNLSIGGAEKVMLLLAEQFRASGYTVRIILRKKVDSVYQIRAEKNLEIIDLDASKVRYFPQALIKEYRKIGLPDVVIVSLWPLTFLTALILKSLSRPTKVICIEHGSLKYQTRKKSRLHKFFLHQSLKITLKLCDRFVCVSEGLKEEIKSLTNYQGKKLISIPNPIELEELDKAVTIPDSLIGKLHGHIFLSVGRLKKVKNIPLLLKSFKQVVEQMQATLLIVGDGPESKSLQELASSLGIIDKVHFLGFKNPCQPFYDVANTFVLSSDSEGFGNVIVEALAHGCTVVSTDCPYGPREILKNGKFGCLVEPDNIEELSKAMMLAVDRPFLKSKLKARASTYTPKSIAQQYLNAIESIK